MPIYQVTPLTRNTAAINQKVEATIEEKDRIKLQADAGWFVDFPGTTIELSKALGVTGVPEGVAPLGSVLIVAVSSYFGRGPTDMWEWLKTRFERQ